MFRVDPWWGLPGPGSFLAKLADELRSGRNVLLMLPSHAPSGLDDALDQLLRNDGSLYFQMLNLGSEDADATPSKPPPRLIHDRFAPLRSRSPAISASARTVAFAEELAGTVIWVSEITDDLWPAWSRFLVEYKDACRQREAHVRCRLVVQIAGKPASEAPPDDVALSVQRWEGIVRRFDMLIYAHQRIERSNIPPALWDLAAAVTAEVAGTDRILADRMTETTLDRMLEPYELLKQVAGERGWRGSTVAAADWSRGMVDLRDGKKHPHSAAEIAAGRDFTVKSRVWRGQVAALYSILEELRLGFIRAHRSGLNDHRNEYGETFQVDALEFTHLVAQLRGRLSPSRLHSVEFCKRLRNELAHLQPLRADDVLALSSLST